MRVTRSDVDIQGDLFDTKDQNGFFIDSKSFEVRTQNSYNIDLGLDAQLSEKHSLNFSGAIIPSRNNNLLENNTSIFKGKADLQEILISQTNLNATTNNYNFNLGHRWNRSSSENLSADVSYGNFNTDRNTDQPNTFLGFDTQLTANSQVLIAIKNNGPGISDAIKGKIIQPFFTTKPTGKGTGLGLSLSYDIVVTGHKGMIEVNSIENLGTTFTVKVPIS